MLQQQAARALQGLGMQQARPAAMQPNAGNALLEALRQQQQQQQRMQQQQQQADLGMMGSVVPMLT